MRDRINTSLKEAMRAKEADRLGTLRLIMAAIKDKEIAVRSDADSEGVNDADILSILAKMIKQRVESANTYEGAGRQDLADQEHREIKVIEEFLPKQLNEDEIRAAVQGAIDTSGADSIRDMGRVMGSLKGEFAGQMDFGKAGAIVKELLG
jgi:uncharacterized protein YqeY